MKINLFKKLWRNNFKSYAIMNILGIIKFKLIKEEENKVLYQQSVNYKNPIIWILAILNIIICLLIYFLRKISDKFTKWYYINNNTDILLKNKEKNESTNTSGDNQKV